jgi:hypothetical protein
MGHRKRDGFVGTECRLISTHRVPRSKPSKQITQMSSTFRLRSCVDGPQSTIGGKPVPLINVYVVTIMPSRLET